MEESEFTSSTKNENYFSELGFGLFDLEENTDDEYTPIVDLETFLKDNYDGSIIVLKKSNYDDLRRPLLVFFHHFKRKFTKLKEWTDKLYEISGKFSNTIQFAVGDFEDIDLFHLDCNELDIFGFNRRSEPYIFAVDANDRQYQFEETFSALSDYCEKLEENKLYRSDSLNNVDDLDPYVDIIVADNFRELVEQNQKDVFVTLHSNYTWNFGLHQWNIPKMLSKDRDTLVFYKINVQTNYIPLEYKASQYPTSFLIPFCDRTKRFRYLHTHYDYSNVRRFIAKNTSNELKTLDRRGIEKEGNTLNAEDEDREILDKHIKKLAVMVEKKLIPEKENSAFNNFLGSYLRKFDEVERNFIKVKLIALASNRVNEILIKT